MEQKLFQINTCGNTLLGELDLYRCFLVKIEDLLGNLDLSRNFCVGGKCILSPPWLPLFFLFLLWSSWSQLLRGLCHNCLDVGQLSEMFSISRLPVTFPRVSESILVCRRSLLSRIRNFSKKWDAKYKLSSSIPTVSQLTLKILCGCVGLFWRWALEEKNQRQRWCDGLCIEFKDADSFS